ncbi:MAG: hypothetical protein KC502_19100 [Myxococcales bacterium]|nr:hypothetical protein [Myxococcales bacterium]
MRSIRMHVVQFAVAALAVVAVAGVVATPSAASADPASDSLAQAKVGAVHFRAKRFLDAARAFEQAYRLNPVDARNLRYAGRAWQEVGHWERALNLLQRYAQLEKKPDLRLSIQPRIAQLKAATARQKAEQLAIASVKYPQGKLEIEAARALERLGTRPDYERAIKLYETARLWATSPAKQAQVEAALDRLRGKLLAADKPAPTPVAKPVTKPVTPANPPPIKPAPVVPVPPVKPDPKEDSLGTILYIVGGVALVGGAGVGALGYLNGKEATDAYVADETLPKDQSTYKGDYDAYKTDVDSAKVLNLLGGVAAGVGAAVLVWAIVRGGSDTAAKKSAWWVAPSLSGRGAAVSAGLRF